MAIGRVNTGGGAGLNYSIRASASVPTGTGKTNEIVIVTSTAIGDVQLNCPVAPTSRSDVTAIQNGDVYFTVLTTTTFNALKKQALYGLLGQCKQRVGGVWTDKDAYIYQNSTWVHFSAMLPPVGTALANCTWSQISAVGSAGLADTYWNVGDEKTITLSTSESVTLQIIGFEHDDLPNSGGKAPITFCFKNCLSTKMAMNPTGTNTGGYSGSVLYQTINGSIFNSLPTELRDVMKTVNKNTTAGSQSSTIVTTQEKLFLMSEIEVLGQLYNSGAGEGARYAFFTTAASRTKKVSYTDSIWNLRSPMMSSGIYFANINASGGSTYYHANTSMGVPLALCV